MGRDQPPRVTYWTGVWDPAREALSSQVNTLRHLDGRRAPVVSFSPGQQAAVSPRARVVRLSGRQWPVLRALAVALERLGDVTHVFGPMNAWHLLRAVGRRPVVFTAAIPGPALDHAMYGKVSVFVAETESLASALRNAGVPGARLRVVHPGIDLRRFTPLASASGRFRVLFASTPASGADFKARGIPLMIDAARLCPEIDLYLPWRQWGNPGDAKRALAALRPPPNVLVEHRDIPDMSEVLHQSHATIWVAEPGHGKSCPNSVIEGLACGLPAVVSPSCGIADLITRRGAGIAPDREPQAIAAALRTFAQNAAAWRERARDTAVRFFSLEAFCGAYRELYAAAMQQTPVNEGEDPVRAATADAAIATSRQDL